MMTAKTVLHFITKERIYNKLQYSVIFTFINLLESTNTKQTRNTIPL